ncbi:MAG: enoyl-CoA hydratase/isomerase family protein [Spongiibacteraceae bacterium]|nr:enoyl-CoA hydratase/isomerase family protein [Spongiibacteraceae bacterium]
MQYQHIHCHVSDGVATLCLNRPKSLNSFTVEMHVELRAALDEIKSNRAVRCVLLTGAGRGFCAGQDLSDRKVSADQGPVDLGESLEKNYNPLIRKITSLELLNLPCPSIRCTTFLHSTKASRIIDYRHNQ